jgi:hypothetical protein
MKINHNGVTWLPIIAGVSITAVIVLALGLSYGGEWYQSVTDPSSLSTAPTLSPVATPLEAINTDNTIQRSTAKIGTQQVEADPIVNCPIHQKCGGGSIELRNSACEKTYCCMYPDGRTVFMLDRAECVGSSQAKGATAKTKSALEESQQVAGQMTSISDTPSSNSDGQYQQCISNTKAQLDLCNQQCTQAYREISQSGEYDSKKMMECYSVCGQQYSLSKCSN